MRSRSTTAVGLAALAIAGLTLAGCSAGGSDNGKVTITYATSAGADVFNKGEKVLIDAFQKANPNITVKVEQIPLANYNTKLTTEFRGGQGPDLGRVNHTDIQTFAAGNFLAPLDSIIKDDKIDTDQLIPGLVDVGKVAGKQMTLPIGTDTRALFYNPALLKSKGIDKPPATWEELLADVKLFAGGDVYGYGFPSDTDYALTYETVGPYMKGADGEILKSDGKTSKAVAADSDGTLAAVKLIQDIVKTGAVPPGTDNMTGDTLGQLFAQNKLAFMLGGPWVKATLETNNPNIKYGTDYETSVVPVQKAGEPSGSTAGGWQIGVFKNSKNQAAAGKLLAYIMERENLITLNKAEAFPPLKDGLSTSPWSDDPFYKAYNEILPHAGLPLPPVTRIAEVSAAFEKTVIPVIVDPSKSAESALKDFDQQVNTQILG
jgi:multiple sugar transport system substrate-binding protein